MRNVIGLLLAGLLCFLPQDARAEGEAGRAPVVTISHFTGKPVPRFERLKAAKVNGRAGPSTEHPVVWQYAREGLPVLVLKESVSWRRVRDPDGDEVWIHASLLAGGSTALLEQDAVLRQQPDAGAGAVLRAEAGVIAALLTCEAGWCRIALDRHKGWVPEAVLWGAALPGERL